MNTLRERHNLSHGKKRFEVHVGDVVLVESDEKNRGKWPLAIVRAIYPGRDDVVRAVQLQTGKGFPERPIQHLYPLELACDKIPEKKKPMNNNNNNNKFNTFIALFTIIDQKRFTELTIDAIFTLLISYIVMKLLNINIPKIQYPYLIKSQ